MTIKLNLSNQSEDEHRLRLCERCGRLMTPHAFAIHEQGFRCLTETELEEFNIFQIKFAPQQVLLYDREFYYADAHMFDGLSDECIPRYYLSEYHPKILTLLERSRYNSPTNRTNKLV